VACRTVGEVEPAALLLLAFPLHPSRRSTVTGPPPTRLPELVEAEPPPLRDELHEQQQRILQRYAALSEKYQESKSANDIPLR
jgi:hypothetical protein